MVSQSALFVFQGQSAKRGGKMELCALFSVQTRPLAAGDAYPICEIIWGEQTN
jgi:hypothetical protein